MSSITYHQFRRNSDKSEEDITERPVETKEGERDSTEELYKETKSKAEEEETK